MFANTIDITYGGGTITLTRINQDKYSSEYRYFNASNGIRMNLSFRHSSYVDKARSGVVVDRHNAELVQLIPNDDGTITRCKAYLVFENDSSDGASQITDTPLALTAYLNGTVLGKMAGWES